VTDMYIVAIRNGLYYRFSAFTAYVIGLTLLAYVLFQNLVIVLEIG